MFNRLLLSLSLIATALPLTQASAQSSTIRVEPRPYYGAVVTVEQGVRVWRPLPPTSHMIINPTGSPVHVNVTDVRETINHHGSRGAHGQDAAPYATGGAGYHGAPAYYAGRHFNNHRHHHHHRRTPGLGR